MRDSEFGYHQRRAAVQVHHSIKELVVYRFQPVAAAQPTGVIDQDVDAAEAGDKGFHQRFTTGGTR
ncbi:hypothetical protein D3C78_1931310 [compost metagenome]